MYQVLARKWRPQSFEEVVGQEPITKTLQNALAAGRVAHAFLFDGPRGVGKTSVARILAKALNCQDGPTPHPCNRCQTCREITGGSSMDVLEIDGASNRGIDEVRDLREKIKYAPTRGQYRVYIIDEVHMLTKEAFNALLKTLEEPPAHAVFILATTEPHKVPATILSRCQRYDFRRIPAALIQTHLETLVRQEGWEIDTEGLALIAREAEGSLRDAQGFLDQVVTFGGPDVSAAEIARILGVTDRGALLRALEAVVEREGSDLLALIDELYNQGHDLKRFYQDLVHYARHLLLAGLYPEGRNLAAVADSEWEELVGLARRRPAVHLHNLMSVLLQGEEDLRRASQPRLALEVLLLRLIHLEPLLPVGEWLGRLEALEKRLATGAGQGSDHPPPRELKLEEAEPQPTSPSLAKPLSAADLPEQWEAFLGYVKEKEGVPLWGKLAHSRAVDLTDHCLTVEMGRAWNAAGAQQEKQLDELLRAFFGPPYSLCIRVAAKEREASGKKEKPLSRKALRQEALEIFGGHWLTPTEKEESP